MASVSSTGVGSGLDVGTIVSSLMAVEQRPLTQLQTQAATIQTRISAFGNLKGTLASLGDVAAKLATASSWNALTVDSGNSSAVTATASATAAAGAHTIEVTKLAQAQVLASGNFGSSASVVGTGKLTIELGATASDGTFTPKAGAAAVPITIDSSNQTLAGVRDAINAAGAGVTASIVNGTGGARLVLRGADGAASSVRITVQDDDGNNADSTAPAPGVSPGLSQLAFDPAAAAGTGKNLSQTQNAQDAEFKIDGVDLTSATNSPTGVLDGVTITLKNETDGPIALNISVQTMAIRANVNNFVNAYNALNTLLRGQTNIDPSGKSNGPLQSDSTAVGLLYQMRTMLRGSVTGLSAPDSLNAAGIELQQDGSLTVNDSKLSKLLDPPAKLAQLFSQAGTGNGTGTDPTAGFGVRFKQWANALTGDSGMLTSRVTGLQANAKDNQKRQDAMQDRLTATEARLRAQYQALDTQMSTLNQQMAQMKSALGLA